MKPWLRLDVDFDEREWMLPLSKEAQFAFVDLMRHVRMSAPRTGIVEARSAAVWAKKWGWSSAKPVEEMLQAGEGHAFTTKGGQLQLLDLSSMKSPDAARKAEERAETPGVSESVHECPDKTGQTVECPEMSNGGRTTLDNTVTRPLPEPIPIPEPDTRVIPANAGAEVIVLARPSDGIKPFDRTSRVLSSLAESQGWDAPTSADIQRHLRIINGDLLPWCDSKAMDGDGEGLALSMMLHIRKTWSSATACSWEVVYRKREDILREMVNGPKAKGRTAEAMRDEALAAIQGMRTR